MSRIFGLDIGTTSIGFAVVDYDPQRDDGRIVRLGVRIFPEARDPDGTPLNQQRRQKRMARRQLRRRRKRRRVLNQALHGADLLPPFDPDKKSAWANLMRLEPWALRVRGLSEPLTPYELGRAVYHLAQRRHFKGRDLEELSAIEEAVDEKEAKTDRDSTLRALRNEGLTLGAWLAKRGPHERKRGVHAHRDAVANEFEMLWTAQSAHHPVLREDSFKAQINDAIFAQRPVFWRKNTLGDCRFVPGAALCPKGAWLSQQRRMLEKLNNLAVAGGNARPLDDEERAAILAKLQTQASMTWAGVRAALRPLYKARGEAGAEKSLEFNLQLGGEDKLLGNAVEGKLSKIFAAAWEAHPHKQAIRDAVHQRLWSADYGEIGAQRVVILSSSERKTRRGDAAESFIRDYGVTREQAKALQELSFPTGWEPFSVAALQAMLPHLEDGVRFGALTNAPEWEEWRDATFPDRDRPTSEFLDRLPSPASPQEQHRIRKLRNPTVVRTQNELRKVVNNLIDRYGKPDRIRIELARDVGKSKREREKIQSDIRKQERRRKEAIKDLGSNRIGEPSRETVEKWLLWKESGERCPYTGDQIGFDALFREGRYEVEHIWPRSRCFDDGFRNKTLCRKDVNLAKSNMTPYEYFGSNTGRWREVQALLGRMMSSRGGVGMSPGKVKRFLADSIPEGFAERQLNDTGYAARQAMAFLQRLWPDAGPAAPVTVEAVTGRVTAQLRRLWGLNNILADDGKKTREDHRHHAIDALVVACTHPGMTNRLSRYWQVRDELRAERPDLAPPWPTIRADAERAVANIVVSHRVRRKVSGPLHKETTYGDTGEDVTTKTGTYRRFVTRKKVEELTKSDLEEIRDPRIRGILTDWVSAKGGDPKKAFPPYPRLGGGGPEIRRVRISSKQQLRLMAPVSTGYADLGSNHHIALYRQPDGKVLFEVVSLFEASRRLARQEPVVRRARDDGAEFAMSLGAGDTVEFPDGDRKGFRIVQGVWASGVIVTLDHVDAVGASVWRPSGGSILASRARKVSVDPIGRVRKAND